MEAHVDETARGRRERWWRSVFLVVATVYVSLLLIGLLFQILGGFAQIALIVFMAWLLAFVLRRWSPGSPTARIGRGQ